MKRINVKGTIISSDVQWIYDLFDIEATSPNKIADALTDANGEDIEVVINSGGGDVFAGSEIYTELKSYSGNVTNKIVGIAASAASVIAMSGKTLISPTAQIMIHNVSSRARGDYRDLQHESDVLKNYNKSIASAYILKSGMKEDELLELMDNETWFNAQQAKEYGFVDEIMFEEGQPQFAANYSNSPMLPQQVIDTIRNMKDTFNPTNSNPKENKPDILMQQKAKLNLLKLKGDVE